MVASSIIVVPLLLYRRGNPGSWFRPAGNAATACPGKRIGRLVRLQGMGHAQDEFADFYRASRDSCLKAVTAITGDPELAEELLAEAFARAWTSWGKVRGHAAPRAWVVRTAL